VVENNDRELLSRQVKQLYALAPVGIIASLINGSILIYIQWNLIPHDVLLGWLVVLILLNVLWMVLYVQFQKASQGEWNPNVWRYLFIGGTLASGCLWGTTGILAFPEHSIPHQIFLAFVLGGMIAGATAVYAALQEVFLAYALPTITPLLVQFFVQNDELHLAMGGMGLLFVGLMCVTMRHNHKVMVASMNLSRELGKANQLLQSEIHERQQAESALRQSQEQLQSVVQSTDEGIISLNSQGEVIFWNTGAENLFGYSQEEMQGRTLDRIIPERFRQAHQAGIERATRAGKRTIDVELLEVTGLRRDGSEFPLEISLGYWHKNEEIFFMGIVRDITVRKETEMALKRREWELQQSQEELRALGTRLISAQEDERRRLSCELHDDMNQRLAVLALQIQSVQKTLPTADPMRVILQRLDEQVSSLSDDVRRLAHQLHPSILHELGLVVALKAFINDFAKWEEDLSVRFQYEHVPHGLPKEIALCIFRVTQECLRNVAKHAQASRVSVRLRGLETGIELIIQDNGRGFNPETVRPAQGLGLIGMKERVLAVRGTFHVKSSKSQGTTITAWIPLSPTN
jgi:PAS domain S-box-containing protein